MIRAKLANGASYIYKAYKEPGSVTRQRMMRLPVTAYRAHLQGKLTREHKRWAGRLVRPVYLGLVK